MKHLITAIASLIVLMTVFFQIFTVEFSNVKISMIDQAVYEFKERAKYEGCVSTQNKEELARKLGEVTGNSEKAAITGDEEIKGFREPIQYEIKVPIDGIMSNKLVFSSSSAKPYVFKGQVLSCYKEEAKGEDASSNTSEVDLDKDSEGDKSEDDDSPVGEEGGES